MIAALSINLSASLSFLDCSPVIPRTIKIKSGMNKIKQMYSTPRVTLVDSIVSNKTDVLTKKKTNIMIIDKSKYIFVFLVIFDKYDITLITTY